MLSDQLSLLVDLTGSIDIPTEINRLQKEKERLIPLVESYRRKMSGPGYEEKVPEAVRIVNRDNLVSYETELDAIKSALETFQRMLL